MKLPKKTKKIAKFCLATLTALAANQLQAVEMPVFTTNLPPVDFHGFASQGYIWNSGNNDYLGGKSHDGTFDFREYGVNASMTYDKFRVGAQIFAQKLGQYGNDDPSLDWGVVDYHASQWFGITAGRVKMPRGLYNETLDLDSTRAFVLLPQSVYDARLRDFNASVDGGEIYGNIEMSKAGSLDYKLFAGAMPISMESGAVDYFNTSYNSTTLDMSVDSCYGGTLFWNTPINGLRAGYSLNFIDGLSISRHSSSFLGYYTKSGSTMPRQLASLEYVYGNWTFAGELGMESTTYTLHAANGFTIPYDFTDVMGYLSVSRRINKWLTLGAYYSGYQENAQTFPDLTQHDFALAARFDITDYLIFKLEGHYLNDSGKVFDTPSHPQPLAKRDSDWMMIDAKVTFSF